MKIGKLAFVAIVAVLMAGCAKKNGPADLPPAPSDVAPESVPTSSSNAPVAGSQADFLANVTSDRVFFDTDKSDVRAEDQAALRSQAQWLARYPQKKIVIEGHCDERGTREYNLALGERRANAAKNYLAALGVDPSRMSVFSYGKERPAAVGSDPESWAQNRRAVTVTVE